MLLNLAGSQEKLGCRNSLLLFYNVHKPNMEFFERARHIGLSARMVRCEGRVDFRTVRDIRECIRGDKIDLVHSHGYKADLYGYLAASREAKPIVATCHNWLGGSASLGIYNQLDRMALRKFNAVAAVSGEVADKLRASGIAESKIRVISNGVKAALFCGAAAAEVRPASVKGKTIGMVARLDLQKGFEVLLQAILDLKSVFPELLLAIVGEGPDRERIQEIVQQLGLAQNVVLLGQRNDMPAIYAAMDIFVLPSFNEGLPMTVLEAMAAGKPVVATRVGAIPSVLQDGEAGLLVTPGDGNSLRQALARLLSDPALCARLGRHGQWYVQQNYTSEVMARNYIRMYRDVLHQQHPCAEVPEQETVSSGERVGSL
ncbi:MAG TPA: glycosyltransferase family 4 protein [Candidatus Limnocylindrales bacterium]|nr:glycosyltransferase family 4 protein [Candidatus Limnocylindrales bacterium]